MRYVMTIKSIFFTIGCAFLGATVCRAVPVYLDQTVRADFRPVDAFLIVTVEEGHALRVPALVVARFEKDAQANTNEWLVGAAFELPSMQREVEFSAIVLSQSGEIAFSVPTRGEVYPARAESIDRLREILVVRRGDLLDLQSQAAAQRQELKRLRSDAEVIANIGKIIELQENIAHYRIQTENLEADLTRLKRGLKNASLLPRPASFVKRESDLNHQVRELAQVASDVEKTETERRRSAEIGALPETNMPSYEQKNGVPPADMNYE